MQVDPSLADNVARIVLDSYDSLPKVGKPIVRSNGVPEWTILAGVVVQSEGVQNCDDQLIYRFYLELPIIGNGSQMFTALQGYESSGTRAS